MPTDESDDLLTVGILGSPHGIRGEVRLRPVTEFPERLPTLRELHLRYPDGRMEQRRLLGTRPHQGALLLRLEGIDSRDAAAALCGAAAVVRLSQTAPLPDGRYYVHQIVGLRVLTPEGEELGTVREVLSLPSNDVYVAGRYMIPATHDAVLRLAPDEGFLVVRSRDYLEGEEVR